MTILLPTYFMPPLPPPLRLPLKKHITWMTLNQDGCREEALDFNPPVIPWDLGSELEPWPLDY